MNQTEDRPAQNVENRRCVLRSDERYWLEQTSEKAAGSMPAAFRSGK
jgi:hypothetical protein